MVVGYVGQMRLLGGAVEVSKVTSAIYSGLNAYKQAEQGVEDAAVNITRLNTQRDNVQEVLEQPAVEQTPPPSLSAEAVNLVVNEHLAKASVKVIQTADEMLGSLIDTKV